MKKVFYFLFAFLTLSASAQEVTKSYDKIGKFENGVAIVWKSGQCGLITQGGKELIKPEYDEISGFGRDGIAYTTKEGLKGLISIEGKVIVPTIYTYIGGFKDYYAITRKNGMAGMINKHGKILVENKYDEIKVERNGVIRASKGGKWVILDLK